jgi:hypothetical protein
MAAEAAMKARKGVDDAASSLKLPDKYKDYNRNVTCERPTRLRQIGTGAFFDGASSPPQDEGNMLV